MKTRSTKVVRCAIYTRVSTDQGLEQDFNSLDAQYEASQAYIRSQAHAGWTLLRAKYDDGGFSGGHTDRPALRRLLALPDLEFAIYEKARPDQAAAALAAVLLTLAQGPSRPAI